MKYVDCSAPVREYLCQADPVLGAHIQRIGELYRPMKDDLFTALCSSIMNEVSYKVSKATGVPVKRVDVYVDTMLIG